MKTLAWALCAGLAVLAAPLAAKQRPAKFGHFRYDEAPKAALADAGLYRDTGRIVLLRAVAADAFRTMAAAAETDGVRLIPISGFRPVKYQRGLFERGVKKHGSPREAAKWVAPPGHSEHATGWTLDLGDGAAPDTDVEQSFETTAAFAWLIKNAARFAFELSFPKDNPQGVSYEPWHWRYVGTEEAGETFDTASKL